MSFSAAIQDFRTTRIEEVICYRFDQFDTAAQLLLKLASVACANAEVFSLPLLDFMIQDDRSTMSAFACLHSGSMDEYESGGGGSSGRNPGSLSEEGDTVGFEQEEPRHVNAETGNSLCLPICMCMHVATIRLVLTVCCCVAALLTETVLVETLNSLLNNNEFIRVVSKRQESIAGKAWLLLPLCWLWGYG